MGYLRKYTGRITISSGTTGTFNLNGGNAVSGMIRGFFFEDNGGPATQDLDVLARFDEDGHAFFITMYEINNFNADVFIHGEGTNQETLSMPIVESSIRVRISGGNTSTDIRCVVYLEENPV